MFPQLRLTPTRAAFARPGPNATPFPDVTAPMQPSDSLVSVGRRSGHPSQAAYPGAQVFFFTAAPVPTLPDATPETFLPRLPTSRLSPRKDEGLPGAWAILFVRAVVDHPAGCDRPSPNLGAVAVAFRISNALDTRKSIFFRGCMAHGPLARVPTLRRIRYRLRRKARYRPGGLTLGRAGFAPAG